MKIGSLILFSRVPYLASKYGRGIIMPIGFIRLIRPINSQFLGWGSGADHGGIGGASTVRYAIRFRRSPGPVSGKSAEIFGMKSGRYCIRQADPHRFVQIAAQHIHFHEELMPFVRFFEPDAFDLDFRRPDLLRLVGRFQLNVWRIFNNASSTVLT